MSMSVGVNMLMCIYTLTHSHHPNRSFTQAVVPALMYELAYICTYKHLQGLQGIHAVEHPFGERSDLHVAKHPARIHGHGHGHGHGNGHDMRHGHDHGHRYYDLLPGGASCECMHVTTHLRAIGYCLVSSHNRKRASLSTAARSEVLSYQYCLLVF
jgi:hypothetical protein